MAEKEKERPVVAYLGPEGSYTHQAAQTAFPATTAATLTPVPTIEHVFSAVQSGSATRGVVPFENSSNGSVVFTLDLFADLQGLYPRILVCGEAYVGVRHCLLGFAAGGDAAASVEGGGEGGNREEGEDGKPLHSLSHIKTLYSHPQAWGQCKTFLSTYLPHAERHDASSTSRAAEIAAKDKSGRTAALSSPLAAELFGLDVLARSVNDVVGNTTRFLVLRRADIDIEDGEEEEEEGMTATKPTNQNEDEDAENKVSREETSKSLITFTINHSNPGALAACLDVFSRNGINLTSINTRPSGVERWNYIFFVEFKGRRCGGGGRCGCGGEGGGGEGGEGERREGTMCVVDKALKELEGVCKGFRWLGSWENRDRVLEG